MQVKQNADRNGKNLFILIILVGLNFQLGPKYNEMWIKNKTVNVITPWNMITSIAFFYSNNLMEYGCDITLKNSVTVWMSRTIQDLVMKDYFGQRVHVFVILFSDLCTVFWQLEERYLHWNFIFVRKSNLLWDENFEFNASNGHWYNGHQYIARRHSVFPLKSQFLLGGRLHFILYILLTSIMSMMNDSVLFTMSLKSLLWFRPAKPIQIITFECFQLLFSLMSQR